MAATLAACLVGAGCAVPLTSQVRYAGSMRCCTAGGQGVATFVRVADRFSFAPSDGALVIPGQVAPDGSFSGRLITGQPHRDVSGPSDAKTPHFVLTVEGHLDDDAATGVYVNPRCRT